MFTFFQTHSLFKQKQIKSPFNEWMGELSLVKTAQMIDKMSIWLTAMIYAAIQCWQCY